MSLLEITGLTHSFGENLLYKNAGFTLNKGEHIGIVGQNGTGKSTLIKICTEQIIPDSGRVIWRPNITIGYLDQYAEIDHTLTMKEFLKSAFAKLFEIETQVMQLYEKAADGDMKNLELAAYYQEQLETHDFYSIDTAIERVANGLGLLAIAYVLMTDDGGDVYTNAVVSYMKKNIGYETVKNLYSQYSSLE